jgi:hypothetical protein
MVVTAKLLKDEMDIPEEETRALFEIGLLEPHVCKKVLIRAEWNSAGDVKKTDLKYELADKYCVSVSTIEKYVSP